MPSTPDECFKDLIDSILNESHNTIFYIDGVSGSQKHAFIVRLQTWLNENNLNSKIICPSSQVGYHRGAISIESLVGFADEWAISRMQTLNRDGVPDDEMINLVTLANPSPHIETLPATSSLTTIFDLVGTIELGKFLLCIAGLQATPRYKNARHVIVAIGDSTQMSPQVPPNEENDSVLWRRLTASPLLHVSSGGSYLVPHHVTGFNSSLFHRLTRVHAAENDLNYILLILTTCARTMWRPSHVHPIQSNDYPTFSVQPVIIGCHQFTSWTIYGKWWKCPRNAVEFLRKQTGSRSPSL